MTYPRSLKARRETQILTFLPVYPNQPSSSQHAPGQTHGDGRKAGLAGIMLYSTGPPLLRLQGFYQAVARTCEVPNLQVMQAVLEADLAQRALPKHQREQVKAEREIKAEVAAVGTTTLMLMVPPQQIASVFFPRLFLPVRSFTV